MEKGESYDWSMRVFEVEPLHLAVSLRYQQGLVPCLSICLVFLLVDPFGSYDVLPSWERCQLPRLVIDNGFDFFLHGGCPLPTLDAVDGIGVGLGSAALGGSSVNHVLVQIVCLLLLLRGSLQGLLFFSLSVTRTSLCV